MIKFKLALILSMLFANLFCNAQECTKSFFNEENMLKHVRILSSDFYEGRKTGSAGAIRAKKYIINQFHSLNVAPLRASYEQPFIFKKGKEEYRGTNVLGYIKGTSYPNTYIVVSAHYDHLGKNNGKIYNGADDNASGVGALFAFAEYLNKYPPKHSVILAAFDAEELGLKGSTHFINNIVFSPKKIMLNINMDMISRSEKNEIYVVGTNINTSLKKALSCIGSKKLKVVPGHDGYDNKDSWVYASDHTPFHKKGIPFLYFGVENHDDYHEHTDDFENIDQEFYVEVVKTIISVFNKIDLF